MVEQQATGTIKGLSEREVLDRRGQGLGNKLPPPTNRTYAQIVKDNVFTFINNVIFVLALALVLVGRPTDALLSVAVIGTNIVVSVFQELRAKRVLDRIALLTRPRATVVREGQAREVFPDEIVVGDVIKIGAGDQIVVDGQVIGEGRMQVDESQLTGESVPVAKGPGDEVYSGSFCASGSALMVAERVGDSSLANQLTASARAYRRVLTPLQKDINVAIRVILAMVVYLEILLIANNLIKQLPLPDSIATATVVVGLVPNGLFVSIAVAYALGALRIVRFGALVQQSNAIESLSNVTVLCLDKTGTLTTNRLDVYELCPLGVTEDQLKAVLGKITASASTENTTSAAIATAFPAAAIRPCAEAPFSSARKWSAVAFAGDELPGLFALGAPEMLRPHLGSAGAEESPVWRNLSNQAATWSSHGLRVLLVAHHPDAHALAELEGDWQLPGDMTPLGLVSLSDELRSEARATLESFIANGVNPKIISGDNAETVAALAIQAGLDPNAKLVSGLDLVHMSAAEFQEAAVTATVFGRITPQQKESLIDALKASGHYVAMIGDGVNDVLSLKKANLGVAMQSGSQATRSVADIVLMNDSFAALAPAVAEGQRIVNGMQDIIKLFMARIGIMTLIILSSLVIGLFPINIRHGTILTLWTVGIPAVMLAVWARPGYRNYGTMSSQLVHFVLPAAVLGSLLGLLVFYGPLLFRLAESNTLAPAGQNVQNFRAYVAEGQTSLTSFLTFIGLLLVVFVEPPTEWWVGGDSYSGDWRATILAVALAVAYVAIMVTPLARQFFGLEPLRWQNILLLVGSVLLWMFLLRWVWRSNALDRFFSLA